MKKLTEEEINAYVGQTMNGFYIAYRLPALPSARAYYVGCCVNCGREYRLTRGAIKSTVCACKKGVEPPADLSRKNKNESYCYNNERVCDKCLKVCCWECERYEKCKSPCTLKPNKCGGRKGEY